MKIYRYSGGPVQNGNETDYQNLVCRSIIPPENYPEFLSLVEKEEWMFDWKFGFTKKQLIGANVRAKDWMKTIGKLEWNAEFPLRSYEVEDESVIEFEDQVIFNVGGITGW